MVSGDYSDVELSYLVETEGVSQLADLIYRRTNIGFVGGFDSDQLKQIAELVAKSLGWKKSETKAQIESIELDKVLV